MVNLENKIRLNKDLVIYENFLTSEECSKIIAVLDKSAKNGSMAWMPISFYESYSSVLPQDGDKEIIDVPSEDKAWLEKVGQITKTEKPKPVSKKD